MFRKIRNLIETVIFLYALIQAAFGWYHLVKDWSEELTYQTRMFLRARKNLRQN